MRSDKDQGLAVQKLRERSVSMLDAGHVDDAALDIEAADALQAASEREAKLREENERLQQGEARLSLQLNDIAREDAARITALEAALPRHAGMRWKACLFSWGSCGTLTPT